MIDSEDLFSMTAAIAQGISREATQFTAPEFDDIWETLTAEIAEIHARGHGVDIPHEWNVPTNYRPTRPAE